MIKNINKINNALLSLTKAAYIAPATNPINLHYMIASGIIFVDAEGAVLTEVDVIPVSSACEKYGYNELNFNNTLIPDFLAADLADDEFYIAQILHYAAGVGLNPLTPFYVPSTYLTKEEAGPAFKITPIRALTTEEEIIAAINNLFTSTIAPNANDITYYTILAPLATCALSEIKSKELMCIICAALAITPKDPEDILRYLIYRATGSTLLIKNAETIEALKASSSIIPLVKAIGKDEKKMAALATIFYRYKPLFLALKHVGGTNTIINKIRRLAVKYHKPQSPYVLKNVLALAAEGNLKEAYDIVDRATNRELIKLINACRNYNNNLFQIRNGKVYVAEKREREINSGIILLECHLEALLHERLSKVYEGKTFIIPAAVHYAAPVSEKQMVGAFPWGSYIKTNNSNTTVGIHWINGETRTDLDLHAFSPYKHYGWNAARRSENNSIMYSGDLTDAPAPNGATECYYLNNTEDPIMFNVSFFNGSPLNNTFQFYITSGDATTEKKTFNQLDLLTAPFPIAANASDNGNLGLFKNDAFYFYGGNISEGAVPQTNYADFIEATINSVTRKVSLNDLLRDTGATILSEIPENASEEDYINLSPELLTPNTLLNIIDAENKAEMQ